MNYSLLPDLPWIISDPPTPVIYLDLFRVSFVFVVCLVVCLNTYPVHPSKPPLTPPPYHSSKVTFYCNYCIALLHYCIIALVPTGAFMKYVWKCKRLTTFGLHCTFTHYLQRAHCWNRGNYKHPNITASQFC